MEMSMEIRPPLRGKQSGFTLVELLIVVLIIAILMGVALPLYLSAVADSQLKTCRANMQTIANAAVAARIRMGAQDFTQIIADNRRGLDINADDADIGALTDLPAIPVCPSHGTYELRKGDTDDDTTFKVRCKGTDHGTYQPDFNFN
jgi:prepilin-type N-terminal cleavage/methylation domain-containing protein